MVEIVIALFLVAIWAVVLGPSLVKRRVERRSSHSIGTFHRQLGVLRRTGPSLIPAAHRLQGFAGSVAHPRLGAITEERRPGLIVVRPDARPLTAPVVSRQQVGRQDPFFRSEACQRRKNVLIGLVGVVVVTLLIGLVPGLQLMLVGTLVAILALAGYAAALINLANLAREREAKLHYLPRAQTPSSASVGVQRRAAIR